MVITKLCHKYKLYEISPKYMKGAFIGFGKLGSLNKTNATAIEAKIM